jgi:Family of unknown function (DUF6510)
MHALDGNAIAGALFEHFGTEMTAARAACAQCGTVAQIAELRVYSRAPGTIARCRSCSGVMIVLVDIRGSANINLDGLDLVDPPDARRLQDQPDKSR